VSVHVNTLANVVGRIWVAALGAILIPIYVKLMGVEAYALVGIHATLQIIFGLLDLGLGAGLNRELARLAGTEGSEQEQRDLLATFDLLGMTIGAFAAIAVFALAPLIAYKWVNAQALDRHAIVNAIRMIGVIIGLQLPIGFYHGGINGLERQVLFNGLWITINTIRGAGAVLVLWLVAPTVQAFFAWQLAVTALSAAISALLLHRLVDKGCGRGRPRRVLFDRVWRYSAGWIGNAVGVSLLGLTDKVVLSRMLTLKDFGYYTLASYGAQLLLNLAIAVSAAFFPRFNQLIARKNEARLADEYRRGNQTMATLLIPASLMIVFFSREVLLLWTHDVALTASTAVPFAILAAGMMMFGLSHIAYTAALCEGMFRTAIKMTACLALIWVPAMVLAPRWYGVIGAATVWALMNASRVAIVPLLHHKHLHGEGFIWMRHVLTPLFAAGLVCGVARLLAPTLTNVYVAVAYLGGTWLLMGMVVVAVEPAMRKAAASAFDKFAAAVS